MFELLSLTLKPSCAYKDNKLVQIIAILDKSFKFRVL